MHMRPRVQRAPGLPCVPLGIALRPSIFGANEFANLGRSAPRECGGTPCRHGEEHLRRSNPVLPRGSGLLRFARNDVDGSEHNSTFSRHTAPEFCKFVRPEKRGRREDRVRAAPAVSRAKVANKNAHEHTGSAETLRPSLRNGLTAYLRALPGETRACLSPSPAGSVSSLRT